MSEINDLIINKLVPFRQRLLAVLREKHPYLIGAVESAMDGQKNKFGLLVTENGKVAGEYTFLVSGIDIESVTPGVLESEIKHPLFGAVKPYAVVERADIEEAVNNEEFFSNTLAALKSFLPKTTLKFLA